MQYAYDALGRRTHRTAGGETTVTVYDGLRPIEAYDAGGAWQHTLTYGPGLDEPLGFWNSAGHYNYHLDGQGSVVALTNSSGHVVETYAYGPFGETAGASELGNPLRYTGRAYDAATGLYDNRLRNYHPVLGRFIEPDPIGPAGGINLYAYVNSDPINFIDPLGLVAVAYGSQQGDQTLTGWGMFRPEGHDYVAGRDDTVVEPEGIFGAFIDDHLPGGHTFAVNHDNFVGTAVSAGVPDVVANVPSMPWIYVTSFFQEAVNHSVARYNLFFETNFNVPFPHTDPVGPRPVGGGQP